MRRATRLIISTPVAIALLVSTAAPQSTATQSAAPRKEPPGTVTGHVTLEDTGGPARFAAVTLQPVTIPPGPTRKPADPEPITLSRVVHTTLDGSFLVPDVAPGNYYVLADADAYLSASGLITREQMAHPTKAVAERMAQLLVPVAVASGKSSAVEIRLHRGASLSGAVRFDDGTPFRTTVHLLRKTDKGEWQDYHPHLTYFNQSTDDLGQFRIVGLPAGDYQVRADLSLDEEYISRRGDLNEGWMSNSLYSLPVYSPGVTRQKDARTFHLTDGQDEAGIQIEVPLSKLHSISGTLVQKDSGRPVNAGHIAVLSADDGKELAATDVSAEDNAFHLAFVPEGNYTLKVTDAKFVERTEVPNPPGQMPPFSITMKPLQTFGDAATPLVVTTDVQSIIVAVPPAGQTTSTTPTQAAVPAAENTP